MVIGMRKDESADRVLLLGDNKCALVDDLFGKPSINQFLFRFFAEDHQTIVPPAHHVWIELMTSLALPTTSIIHRTATDGFDGSSTAV